MANHSTPINLPRDNENKDQFLNRSGKILMKTGKSKEESQRIAESIWNNHVQSKVNFQNLSASDVRWVANKTQSLNLNMQNFEAPDMKISQSGRASGGSNIYKQNSSQQQNVPGNVGQNYNNSIISRGLKDLVFGQKQLIQIGQKTSETLIEIYDELQTIRSYGHNIRTVKPPTSKPKPQDYWYRESQMSQKAPMMLRQLSASMPEMKTLFKTLEFIYDPKKAIKSLLDVKVKGILGTLQDALMGPQLKEFQKDPTKLAKASGIQVLEEKELQHKVIGNILPDKLEDLSSLNREQVDLLRNIWEVQRDTLKAISGQDKQYTKTLDTSKRQFDTASGSYMGEKQFAAINMKRQQMMERTLQQAEATSPLLMLSKTFGGGIAKKFGLTTQDEYGNESFDPLELLRRQEKKIFGQNRDLSKQELIKMAKIGIQDNSKMENSLETHAKRQLMFSLERENDLADIDPLTGKKRYLDSPIYRKTASLSNPLEFLNEYLNSGETTRQRLRRHDTGKSRGRKRNDIQEFIDRDSRGNAISSLTDAIDLAGPRWGEEPREDYSGGIDTSIHSNPESFKKRKNWNPLQSNIDQIDLTSKPSEVTFSKDSVRELKGFGGLPIQVMIGNQPIPVITPTDTTDKQNLQSWMSGVRKNFKSRRMGSSKFTLGPRDFRFNNISSYASGIQEIHTPANTDSTLAIVHDGEKIMSQSKSRSMDVALSSMSSDIRQLVKLQQEEVQLTKEQTGYLDNDRTLSRELTEISEKNKETENKDYKKKTIIGQNKVIELLEQLNKKKSGTDDEKKEGGFWKTLKTMFPFLGTIAGLFSGPIVAVLGKLLLPLTGIYAASQTWGDILNALRGIGQGLGILKQSKDAIDTSKNVASITSAVSAADDAKNGTSLATKVMDFAKKGLKSTIDYGKDKGKALLDLGRNAKSSLVKGAAQIADSAVDIGKSTMDFGKRSYEYGKGIVESVVKTVKNAYSIAKEYIIEQLNKLGPLVNKLKSFYDGLKNTKVIGFLLRQIEKVIKYLQEILRKLLTSGGKLVTAFFKNLAIFGVVFDFIDMTWNWNKDSTILNILKVVKTVCSAILAFPVLGICTPVGTTLLLVCGGLSILLTIVIAYLESGEDKDLENAEVPNDLSGEIIKAETESQKISESELDSQAVSSLPDSFKEYDPGPQGKNASTTPPPFMHSGGVVKASTSVPGYGYNSVMGAEGLVSPNDQSEIGKSNLVRTLQDGEYVMTKNETKSIQFSLSELLRYFKIASNDIASISTTLLTLKRYKDEELDRLENKEVNQYVSLNDIETQLSGTSSIPSGSGGSSSGGFLDRLKTSIFGKSKEQKQQDFMTTVKNNIGTDPQQITKFLQDNPELATTENLKYLQRQTTKASQSGTQGGPKNLGPQGGYGQVDKAIDPKQMGNLEQLMARGDIGALSELGETGRLSGKIDTVSDGKGDKGGVSYGLYQFSSKTGGLQNLIDYGLKSEDPEFQRFAKQLQSQSGSATSNSGEFANSWKTLAQQNPEKFKEFQEKGFAEKWYSPAAKKLQDMGIDIGSRSKALQSAVWSTAAQHGAQNNVIRNALQGVENPGSLTDQEIISRIYKERSKTDEQGNLKYFKSSPKLKQGLEARFKREGELALGMLQKETEAKKNQEGASVPSPEIPGAPDVSSKFTSPIGDRQISSGYGYRGATAGGTSDHKGVDIKYKSGEPFKSMLDGKITSIGGKGEYQFVEVKQSDGKTVKYTHVNPGQFKVGDSITAGQELGTVSQFRGSKSHLDVKIKGDDGKYINPEKYFTDQYHSQGQEYKPSYQDAASNKYIKSKEYQDQIAQLKQKDQQASQKTDLPFPDPKDKTEVVQAPSDRIPEVAPTSSGPSNQIPPSPSSDINAAKMMANINIPESVNQIAKEGVYNTTPPSGDKLDKVNFEQTMTQLSPVKESNLDTSKETNEKLNPTTDKPPLVLPPQQMPFPVNMGSSGPSFAHMQDRKVDHVTTSVIEKVFANTIISFMGLVTDFAMGNKSTTVFKNSSIA